MSAHRITLDELRQIIREEAKSMWGRKKSVKHPEEVEADEMPWEDADTPKLKSESARITTLRRRARMLARHLRETRMRIARYERRKRLSERRRRRRR